MQHTIFEYLYRDAGNSKSWGEILLTGRLNEKDIATMRSHFDSQELFIAEQIGIASLRENLWIQCQTTHSDTLDHAWHEFVGIRCATEEETNKMAPWGSTKSFIENILAIKFWKPQLTDDRL